VVAEVADLVEFMVEERKGKDDCGGKRDKVADR
jgi:hypothetical protein